MRSRLFLLHASLLLTTLAACAPQPAGTSPPPAANPESPPVRVTVTDLAAFEAFIATRPDVAAFRARYPGLHLVLPGDIATKELRGDNSRYFAELDDGGRITGGRFQ